MENSEIKFTMLGSGTSIIQGQGRSPSALLEFGKYHLLFDCGWGAIPNIQEGKIDPKNLTDIFITHRHADHLSSLIPLLHSMHNRSLYFPNVARLPKQPLTIHGYQGFEKHYNALRNIMFPERVEKYPISVHEYSSRKRSFEFDGFKVTASLVHHVPDIMKALAFRIDLPDGRSFVYSGDSGYDPRLVKLCRDADLILLESGVPPKHFQQLGARPNHMSPFECGRVASEAGAKRLVTTHRYDLSTREEDLAEVRKNFTGETHIGQDFLTLDF